MEDEDEALVSTFLIKLSGLPNSTSIENIKDCLCHECECDVKKVILQGNIAYAFIIVKDIDELLEKNYTIKETLIEVSLHNDQLELQLDTIEVTGDDDTETLQFYFGGKRSGGNRNKSVESVTKVGTNVVHVKFKSVDDAAAVIAQEKHMITGGSQIRVCYARVSDSNKYERDKILIKNIPKKMKQRTLIALIEGCLDLEFEREFTLNLQAPLALLLFSCHYNEEELQTMAETLASQQIHGNYLSADLCDINHSIIVSGISEEKIVGNDFALQLYFETASSGGGENTVQMLTPTKFKVNFKDPSVILEVLKRKHEKLGPNILVKVCSVLDEFNESTEEKSKLDDGGEFVLQKETQSAKEKNGESDGFASEHHFPSLLDPPVCQQWDPLILKYVRNRCSTSIKNIEEELCVSIEFFDNETISVSPTIDSTLEWQANAFKMLNDVISNVSKETMLIPSEAAVAVYPMLIKHCGEEGLEYSLVQGSNEVSIVGDIESVRELKDIVNEMISRIVKEVDELRIDTLEDYVYLKEYIFSLVQKKHPSLSLQCNDSSMTVTARGSVNDVKEFKIIFYQYLSHSKVPVSLCSAAVKFLQSNSGKQVLSDVTKEAIVVPYFSSSERTGSNSFSLLCPTEFVPQTEVLANSIAQNIIVSHVDIPWEYQTQVAENASSKFSTIITSLANQYAFSAIVDDNVIMLVSTLKDKLVLCEQILRLIKENFVPVPHSIVTKLLDPLIAKYVRLNEKDSLESIKKELQVSIDFNDEKTIAVSPSVRSPPDWQTKSEEMMEDTIFSTLTKDNIDIPFEAAGAVYPMVMTFCKNQHLEYDFGQVGNEIAIAGKTHFVAQLRIKVEEISNKIMKKADELEVALPEDYIYLKECMFSIMQEKHPSLTIQCNDNRLTVSIVGSVKDVKEFKDIFPKYMSHGKVRVSLPTVAVKFLQTDSGQGVLKTITKDAKVFLYFEITDGINQRLDLLHSIEHVSLAEKLADTIKQAIATASCEIPLSFQNQVEGEEYSKFKFNLAEKYSFYSTINENELTVVSTAGDINDVINKLISFINEACSVSETINFSRGVWRLFHTELKVEWSEVKRNLEAKGIDIVVSSKPDASNPHVVIRGETSAVQKAKEDILFHQVSVQSKKIVLSQAGVCSYFLSNNALILKGIEGTARVCIEVEVKGMSSNVFKEVFTGVTEEMMSVCLVVGDLTEFNQAEVIVNAANEELKHKGGVALAIARKGGPSIQQESDDYIKRNKKVATGTAVLFTTTGNLPSSYKAIVHAVGPRYRAENEPQNACATLKQAIFQSLDLAKNYESIAFPAIGGGAFGFPIAVCANIHLEAVVEFSKIEPQNKLRKVYFIIIEENVEVFMQTARIYLSDTLLKQSPTFESLRPLSAPHVAPNASSASSLPPTLTTVAAQQYPKRKTKKHKASCNVPEQGTSLEYIKISKGSITDYPEEALVNTTDENLKLQGYVSQVLLKEAGPDLKKECDAFKKPFRIGSVVATRAYKLRNSKYILHVILPNYDGKSEGVLREVVKNCLDECTRLKVKSLSMPSIGAGNLKYPPDVVARVLIEETISFFKKNNGKTTLKLVNFVIYQQDIFDKFQKVLRLGQQSPNFDSKPIQPPLITKGSVTDFQEEALVLTNNRNLELNGVVGQVLAKWAGPELKKECDASKKPIEFGSVIATKGHSLKAKYILHVILQSCGTSSEESEKVLRKIAVKCLDECTRLKVKSLSMTSIGAGKLGYPSDIVAKALLEETATYLKKNKGSTTIELVRFVIYDQSVYDEFNKVYQQLNAVTTKRKEFSLLQSHPLKLELVEGEIGNDSSAVTVTYDASASLVEKKPLMKLIPNSGGLGRKMTLPVAFHHSAHEQKKFCFACLDKAEKDHYDSIVFPAQFQSQAIAPKAIVDASQKFVATNPTHMKVIRVFYTTLSPEIVQHYEEALKSCGFLMSKAKAISSAFASAVRYSHESKPYFENTPTLESEVVLDIFGKTKEAILIAEQQIRETVKENFIDRKIEYEHIAALSAEAIHEISSIAVSCNVKIDIDEERKVITLRGFQDVHKVRSDIQNILQKISEEEVKQTLADTLYQNIRWVQVPSSGNEEEYAEILNLEIEQAYQKKEKLYYSKEHNFVIDFAKMTDKDLTTDVTAEVRRIEIDVSLPEVWSPMPLDQGKKKVFHLVQLPPTSFEYIVVERAFTQTMTAGKQYTEILSIKRIQNPALYKQYALAKKEMDMRNPVGHINERDLWHGTNLETIEKINTQGFNRSFAGKHATAFGKGVYFATDSAYSHKYADPDINKHRYMYYVQVLTGEYTRGETSTIVPPMKPNQQNPAVLYDSTVNDINKPTIFVVYKDTQNYPAYLVQYR